jgi:dihydroorotate dehydrogenase electron transfer subunit
MDRPVVVKVLENREESENVKTMELGTTIDAKPGQFVMLWIPGVGEKPFSLSKIGEKPEVTYDIRGRFTKALSSLVKGDLIGVRGPYGNGWNLKKTKRVCVVSGGIGMAPIMPLVEAGKIRTVIYGARNKGLLVFKKRLGKAGVKTVFTTDDGSFGKKCFACDALEEVLAGGKYDTVLTCGPERLMRRVVDICLKSKVPCQASLERYMKCGIGVCGACCIDDSGLCACKDGPVFSAQQLAGGEFGRYRRNKAGAKEPI